MLETQSAAPVGILLADDDALGGLLYGIHGMELDRTALQSLADDVSALRQKLPPEILGGEEAYDPTDRETVKDALEAVKELLVNRLLSTRQGS